MAVLTPKGATTAGAGTTSTEKYVPLQNDETFNNTMIPGEQALQGGTPPPANNQQVMRALAVHFHLNPDAPDIQQKLLKVLNKQAQGDWSQWKKGAPQGNRPGEAGYPTTSAGGPGAGGTKVLRPGDPGYPSTETETQGNANAAKAQQRDFEGIAQQMGADPLKDPITAIAEKLNIKLPPGQGANVGQTLGAENAGQNWRNFLLSNINANGTLTKNGQVLADQLMKAGFIRKEDGSKVTANQLQGAYKNLLDYSIYTKTRPSDVITAKTQENAQITGGQKSEAVAYVEDVANQLGVALSPLQENAIITQFTGQVGASGFGSVADEIKRAVAAAYDPTNPNNPPGVATSMAQGIQSAANDYKVPISTGAIGQMVQTALKQGSTDAGQVVDQATQHLQEQAMGLYPTLAGMISQGNTVKSLVDPYNQITQQYTGKASADINNTQSAPGSNIYDAFLQGGPRDSKTGAPTMMTMDQWKKTLMQDPKYGFTKTQGGQDMMEQLSSAILNELGKVTTGSPNQDISNSSFTGSPGTANT